VTDKQKDGQTDRHAHSAHGVPTETVTLQTTVFRNYFHTL